MAANPSLPVHRPSTEMDINAIATRVWRSLDAEAPDSSDSEPERPQAFFADQRLRSLNELADAVRWLIEEQDRLRQRQQRLAQLLAALDQQLRVLPAYVMHVERHALAAEARIAHIQPAASAALTDPAPVAARGDGDRWYSVREAARTLSLSESTVRRYVSQGKLPAVRLPGGRIRLRWSELTAHLSTAGPEQPPLQSD